MISKYIIEVEVMVFHRLRHSVNLVLALMDPHSGIQCTYCINFSGCLFFLEDRSLSHAYWYLQVCSGHVWPLLCQPRALYEHVEVRVYILPGCLILNLSLPLIRLLLLHQSPTILPLLLHLSYVSEEGIFLLKRWIIRRDLRCAVVMMHLFLMMLL